MKLPFQIDLNGKVAVVTGAGGVLMSEFAKALAAKYGLVPERNSKYLRALNLTGRI